MTKTISQQLSARVAWSALGALLLTSVHHAYGAYLYSTPWRLHAVFISAITAAILLGSSLALQRLSGRITIAAFWVFTAITIVIPIAFVGGFEGAYNHALKNALYFGGAPADLMSRLFPAPAYEMPNDVFFELTGMMQLGAGIIAGTALYRLIQARGMSSEVQHARKWAA